MSALSYERVALYGSFKDTVQRAGLLPRGSYSGTASVKAMGFPDRPTNGGCSRETTLPTLMDVYEINGETLERLDELANRHRELADGCWYNRHKCSDAADANWLYAPAQPATAKSPTSVVKQSCSCVPGLDRVATSRFWIGKDNWYQLLGMSLMLAFLFLVSYACVIASRVVVVTLFATLWAALATTLFVQARRKRSLALVHAKRGSHIKIWFRGGVLMYAACVLGAAPLALGLLLTLSQGLGALESTGLVVSIVCLLFAGNKLRRLARTEFSPEAAEFQSLVAARWLTAGTFLFVLVLASFWVAVPDLSGMSWLHAAEYGFGNALGHDALLKYLAGFWTAGDSLRIWFAERASTGFSSWWVWLAAWLLVTVKKFLFVFPALMLIQHAGRGLEALNKQSDVSTSPARVRRVPVWIVAAIAILIPAAFLWDCLAPMPWAWATGKSVVINVGGDTYQLSPNAFDATLNRELHSLAGERRSHLNVLNAKADRQIDALFDAAVANIPAYADWYYSLKGDAQRTIPFFFDPDAKKLAILFDGHLKAKLGGLNKNIAARYSDMQKHMEAEFVSDIKRLLAPFATHPHRQRRSVAKPLSFQSAYSQYVVDALGVDEAQTRVGRAAVIGGAMSLLPRTRLVQRAVMGDKYGLAKLAQPVLKTSAKKLAGTDVVKAGQRLADRTIGKVAAKTIERVGARVTLKGAGEVASRIGLRAGGRYALMALGAGACGVTVVCAGVAVVGTAAWFLLTEEVLVRWDEHSHRAEFEEHLANKLNHVRSVVKQSYSKRLKTMLSDNDHLRSHVVNQVRPVDYL